MPADLYPLESQLLEILSDRVCVIGIGNPLRSDDGAGPAVIEQRTPCTPGLWIDAGAVPENFTDKIVKHKPTNVLVIDAVDFGGSPGECRLLDIHDLDTFAVSTHSGSLSLLSDYLYHRIGCRMFILGIQPETVDVGIGLSNAVALTTRQLAGILSEMLWFGPSPSLPSTR